TGMVNRVPTFIKNIDSFLNTGVSFCGICDGPLYGKNTTIVLGGGNSAVEESAYLSKIASEVHLVVKEDNFRAEPSLVDYLKKLPNVHIYIESEIKELRGESNLES
ncbi:NAD(P)/FAD-dependent oxidoreductase, partial [Mycoplasmopsis synoviae]